MSSCTMFASSSSSSCSSLLTHRHRRNTPPSASSSSSESSIIDATFGRRQGNRRDGKRNIIRPEHSLNLIIGPIFLTNETGTRATTSTRTRSQREYEHRRFRIIFLIIIIIIIIFPHCIHPFHILWIYILYPLRSRAFHQPPRERL